VGQRRNQKGNLKIAWDKRTLWKHINNKGNNKDESRNKWNVD
jgi:hypothetical protein